MTGSETTTEKSDISTITFALHPNVSLRVSLHKSIPINPHQVVNQLLTLPGNTTTEKFAILDANKIITMDQIAVAANTALLRRFQFEQKNGGITTHRRGIALDTILCCAGSTNTASVLKDYAFDQHSIAAKEVGTSSSEGVYDVFLLGYCQSDEEFQDVIETLKLGVAESNSGVEAYLARTRSEKEVNDLMKVYKITKDEVEMCGLSMDKAVINRIASKFYI